MTKKGDLIYVKGIEPRVRLEDGEFGAMCAISDVETLKEYGISIGTNLESKAPPGYDPYHSPLGAYLKRI